MGEIIDAYKKVKSGILKGNIDDTIDNAKNLMSSVQKSSPASKYLGFEAFPGAVPSEKHRREKQEGEDIEAARRAELDRRTKSSMPSRADQELQAKRRAAAYKNKSKGRSSTILSDETLG